MLTGISLMVAVIEVLGGGITGEEGVGGEISEGDGVVNEGNK